MAYGGSNKYMDAAVELGRNPVSKHQIQPEYGDEQADARRDCRTRLARPNSKARTRTGEYSVFPVQLTTSRIGNLTQLIHTLVAICVTVHIHTYSMSDTCWGKEHSYTLSVYTIDYVVNYSFSYP